MRNVAYVSKREHLSLPAAVWCGPRVSLSIFDCDCAGQVFSNHFGLSQPVSDLEPTVGVRGTTWSGDC